MVIAFDAVAGATENPISGTVDWSHTCTGSDRILLVWVLDNVAGAVTGVTYNGVSMTRIIAPYQGYINVYHTLYGLLAPATGSNTVSVSFSSSSSWGGGVSTSYTGVDQSALPTLTDSDTSAPTKVASITSNITTAVGDSWLVCQSRSGSSGNTVAGTGATERYGTNGFSQVYDSGGSLGAAGSKSITTTVATTEVMSQIAVAITPVTVPTTSSVEVKSIAGISNI